MGVVCEKGVITAPGSTGIQTYNLGSAFNGVTPKFLILWATMETTSPALLVNGSQVWAMGFGTRDGGASQQNGICGWATDAAGNSATNRANYVDAVLRGFASDTTTYDYAATLSAFTSGTPSDFRLNWTDVPTTAIKIHYFIVGGTDITAARAGQFSATSAAAADDVTITSGWGQPDAVLFTHDDHAASGAQASDLSIGFGGATDSTDGHGTIYKNVDGGATMSVATVQEAGYIAKFIGAGAIAQSATMSLAAASWPTDGFRVAYIDNMTSGQTNRINYLAIKGTMAVKLGVGTAPTAGGLPVAQTLTGVASTTAKGAIIWGAGQTASGSPISTGTRLGQFHFGAWDGTNEGSAAIVEEDANTASISGRDFSDAKVIRLLDAGAAGAAPTLQAEADGGLSGANATLSWNDIDSQASQYNFIVFGESAAGPQTISGGVASVAHAAPAGKVLQQYTAAPAAVAHSVPRGSVPTGVRARRWDGIGDLLKVAVGNVGGLLNTYSLVALIRRDPSLNSTLLANHASSNAQASSLAIDTNGAVSLSVDFANVPSALTVDRSDGWVIVGVTKTAGTTIPRFHVYKDGAWSHADGSGTIGNTVSGSLAGGTVQFGGVYNGAVKFPLELAVAAEWASVLSDGDFETLEDGWRTQDWLDLSPVALWEFDQASTATAVLDRTGGGADQTSLAGTTVVGDGPGTPAEALDWTYGSVLDGGVAGVAISAPGGTAVQSAPPIFGGVASVAHSVPAGTVIQPQTIAGGRALESDSVPIGTRAQRYTAAPAVEADSVPAGTRRQTYTASPASEADSVPAGTIIQPKLVVGGVAAEADSVPIGTRRQTYTAGPAIEADAALAGTRKQTYTASPAVEADAVPAGKVLQTYTTSPAIETDAAPVGKVLQRYTAGPAMEADSVPAGTAGTANAISGGVASMAHSVPAGSIIQPKLVLGGVAVQANAVPAGKVLQRYTAAPALEADATLVGRVAQVYVGGVPASADSVPVGKVAQIYLAGPASELDTAVAGHVAQLYLAGTATEADSVPAGLGFHPSPYIDYAGPLMLIIDELPDRGLEIVDRQSALGAHARDLQITADASVSGLIVAADDRTLGVDPHSKELSTDDTTRLVEVNG